MRKHTEDELKYKQSLPLEIKVEMTKHLIREWVNEFSVDGVYVSFSGGKDSTVLLHIAREMYPTMPAMFCDTGLEYPEIREFVKTFDNVDWVKPKKNFKQVIEKYGYPFFTKEISCIVGGGNKALRILKAEGVDVGDRDVVVKECAKRLKKEKGEWRHLAQCFGAVTKTNIIKTDVQKEERSKYSDIPKRYKFLIGAPFDLSDKCCKVMKKRPAYKYQRHTKRVPITAQMASESQMRKRTWLSQGCNAFDAEHPVSNPMSFWTEQDVLRYIKENDIKIASIYGDVVCVSGDEAECEYLKTTCLDRTGCMFCGFGCHLEKGEGRFELMKESHPKQYEYIMKPWNEGGLGYKDVIDWINSNSKLNINY